MNQAQALARLRKLFGDKLGYRVDKKAKSAEERDAALEKSLKLYPEQQRLIEARNARLQFLLAADTKYQELCDETKRVVKEREALQGVAFRKPITVGVTSSMFFHVKIEGDNWAEVVALAEEKKAKGEL